MVPQKIPTNPKNIGKMAKNAPAVQVKMHQKWLKMAKNDQKMAQMAKKWQLDIYPDARTVEHSSHSCTTGTPELRAIVHPFRACVPPRTTFICPHVP